ncbi:MAG: AAA family ATPase [Devosiaceae bacterium]|nr:AAA family ATPase [Devosiaceae bacterium MH13]
MRYAFWNNKGGTGKTTLCFQTICSLARNNPDKRILAIDVCPQANLSELLLGSLQGGGSNILLQLQGGNLRQSIGGYFELRLPSAYMVPQFNPHDYITQPNDYNRLVPDNIDLLAGDAILELQANTMYSQSIIPNAAVPNPWLSVIDWLNDFLHLTGNHYDYVVLDLNPSFSLYTQIALAAVNRIVLPVMADDSSRRAIQNAFALSYGLQLPSPTYKQYSFANQMQDAGRSTALTHLIVKNRLTQYVVAASGYASVLSSIDKDVSKLMSSNPEVFSGGSVPDCFVEVKDFQTCGVVAAARGMPFYQMSAKSYDIQGRRTQVKADQIENGISHIMRIVERIQ